MAAEDIERRVRAEHANHVGRHIAATEFDAYLDDDLLTFYPDTPVRFVVIGEPTVRWPDTDWCDPIWDLELADDPDRLLYKRHDTNQPVYLRDLRSFMVYGISHSTSGATDGPRWTLLPERGLWSRLMRKLNR